VAEGFAGTMASRWWPMSSVILVGIESLLGDELAADLRQAGYRVLDGTWSSVEHDTLRRGVSAVFAGIFEDPELGLGLCQRLREANYGGLVLLVAAARSAFDVVRALDVGADDCLLAPVRSDVVVARLRARVRLAQRQRPAPRRPVYVQIAPDDLARLACIGERKIRLTPIEARMLGALLDADGHFVPTESLAKIASPEARLSRASLQVHLAHLRGKLGQEAWRLQNCRAVGYRFLADVARSTDVADEPGDGPEILSRL
jgi:DNA-binding response OmpR family regulator